MKNLFSKDFKKVFLLALPAAFKQLVDILQKLIDMLMVGMINVYAVAAVGMTVQFMMIVNLFMTLYVVGSNAVISRYIGQKRKNRASAVLYTVIVFATILSIFISLLTYNFAQDFYAIMGTKLEVIEAGKKYLGVLSFGFIFIFLDTLMVNALSSASDTKSSLYIKLFSSFLNAFLNYILIFGHFGFNEYGIEGAGYATVISYMFNIVLYFILILKKDSKLTLVPILRLNDLKRVLKIGFHAAVERAISSLGFLIFTSIIAYYTTQQLAGYQIGIRIEGIAFMPGFGFAIAGMALVGQNLGAKNLQKAYNMGIISARIAYSFMGFIGLLLIVFAQELASLFTDDLATIYTSMQYLILVGLVQIPLAVVFVFSAALRGAGATKTTMKINVLSLWFLRVVPSFIAYKLGLDLIVIFIIMNVETFIKSLIFINVYMKKEWLKSKI